jgi:hypothetical protein
MLSVEKINLYRTEPVLAAKYLLDIELTWFQILMLESAWKPLFPLWICSRGLGKTYVAAIWLILKCLLYRDVKAGVYAKDYGYTKETFEKIIEIYEKSPLLQNEVKIPPRITKEESYIEFKNGSYIIAEPVKRSKRRNIVFVDEAREIDFSIVNTVIIPFLNAKHPVLENQMLMASSATYEGTPLHNLFKEYESYIKKKNKDYSVTILDVHDALTGPWMDERVLKNAKLKLLDEEYRMEYLSEWVGLGDGWISGPLVRSSELEFKPEIKGDPAAEYFISNDPGRVAGGDNTSWCICKIVPGEGVRVVRSVAVNGMPIPDQATLLKQLVKDYVNVIAVVMDHEKLGYAIQDSLNQPTIDPRDGETLPPIVAEDDFSVHGALRLIRNINFRAKDVIWKMALITKKALQDDMLHLPKDNYRVYLSEEELSAIPQEERDIIEAYQEISELKKEMCSMVAKANETGTSISLVTSRPGKEKRDRFTALFLAAAPAIEYYKELMNDDDSDLGVFWG